MIVFVPMLGKTMVTVRPNKFRGTKVEEAYWTCTKLKNFWGALTARWTALEIGAPISIPKLLELQVVRLVEEYHRLSVNVRLLKVIEIWLELMSIETGGLVT